MIPTKLARLCLSSLMFSLHFTSKTQSAEFPTGSQLLKGCDFVVPTAGWISNRIPHPGHAHIFRKLQLLFSAPMASRHHISGFWTHHWCQASVLPLKIHWKFRGAFIKALETEQGSVCTVPVSNKMLKNGFASSFASVKAFSTISVCWIRGFHQKQQHKVTIMVFCCVAPPPLPRGRCNFLFSLGKNVLITRACRLSTFPAEAASPAQSETAGNCPHQLNSCLKV